jgi:glycosyltransferase involved in cell wall biosynthesis
MKLSNRKILFLAHSQSIHTKRWAEFFIHKKWDVHIISFHPEKIAGAHNYYLSIGNIAAEGNNFKFLLKLPTIIFLTYRIKPDLISAHYLTSFGFLAYLTFYKKLSISLYGSDVFLYSRKNLIYKFFSKRTLKKAFHIFSVSETMTNFLSSYFGIQPTKITTIQYGIDTYLFQNIKPFKERSYTFFTNRTFVKNSNYPTIIAVMNELKKAKIKYKMLIVAEGPLLEEIKNLVVKNNLENHITFLNTVPPEELAKLLNDAKIFISFTNTDGTPLSLFEAASCGLYPILSKNDANIEWLNKGLRGTCVALSHQNEIVNSILNILQNLDPQNYQRENSNFINKYMSYNKNMSIIEDKMSNLI